MRRCADRGYDLLISFQQLSSDWHVDYEDSRKADGIILLGYGDYLQYRPKLEKLIDRGTHFVRWGSATEGEIGATVSSDNEQGGFEGTTHLLQQGRRRIAFIGTGGPASRRCRSVGEDIAARFAPRESSRTKAVAPTLHRARRKAARRSSN